MSFFLLDHHFFLQHYCSSDWHIHWTRRSKSEKLCLVGNRQKKKLWPDLSQRHRQTFPFDAMFQWKKKKMFAMIFSKGSMQSGLNKKRYAWFDGRIKCLLNCFKMRKKIHSLRQTLKCSFFSSALFCIREFWRDRRKKSRILWKKNELANFENAYGSEYFVLCFESQQTCLSSGVNFWGRTFFPFRVLFS